MRRRATIIILSFVAFLVLEGGCLSALLLPTFVAPIRAAASPVVCPDGHELVQVQSSLSSDCSGGETCYELKCERPDGSRYDSPRMIVALLIIVGGMALGTVILFGVTLRNVQAVIRETIQGAGAG